MNEEKEIFVQDLIDLNCLDETFYLALLNSILEHDTKKKNNS